MCLIDSKELDRIVATHESDKELARMANKIIKRLVDNGFFVEFVDRDMEWDEYPFLQFSRKEIL